MIDRESSSLHARARAMVEAFAQQMARPSLDELACDLARYQAKHMAGYAKLCESQGVDLNNVHHAHLLPGIPTDAFKLTSISTFQESDACVAFRTSGTTGGARGTHLMRTTATYDAGAVAFGRHWLLRDCPSRMPVIVLAPRPEHAQDSSLGHMCARFVEHFGTPATSSDTWLIDNDIIDLSAFDRRVAHAITEGQPVLLLATSFALVHLLDALQDAPFPLPKGSRVMQTGGFKAKSREVAADELRAKLSEAFQLPTRSIVAEYGMTELSSQFYEQTLFDPDVPHGIYAEPPWARVVAVDPDTLAPVADGEVGIAKIIDTLNVDSAVCVLTQDRVRRVSTGFELLGRLPGAPPRGCSLAIEELLTPARHSPTAHDSESRTD